VLLACEGDAEGILSAVGIGYLAHVAPARVRLGRAPVAQPCLDETTLAAPVDVDLARRVLAGYERKVARGCPRSRGSACPGGCAESCGTKVLLAAACDAQEAPEAIHRYLRVAFREGTRVRSLGSEPDVAPFLALARAAANECERTRQFVRFSRLEDGSYLSVFSPKADVLPFVGAHFAMRMGRDRFCLVDPRHGTAVFHQGDQTQAVRLDAAMAEALASEHALADDERYVRAMWKRFYDGLELAGRRAEERGYDLRSQLMPKRFWGGLVELDPRSDDAGGPAPRRYAGGADGAAETNDGAASRGGAAPSLKSVQEEGG
jgi:probable DNA metabolism protein